jgi:2-succinyl-6-hydroxy-2,4-cyclohexadiene-1-carboxylate synthase
MKMWCLHGAMQTTSVWDPFLNKLHLSGRPVAIEKVDLHDNISTSLAQWAQGFCSFVRQDSFPGKPFLLGYSLGGRLAMHAYINSPHLWSGVIVVSADPGTQSKAIKENMLEKDLAWSKRFQSEDLEVLLQEWDRAPVFCQRPNRAPRKLSDLDSSQISKLLSVYSKGRQQNLISFLNQEGGAPVLYLSGEEDHKYSKIGENLARCCLPLSHHIIPDAGHRVPWENSTGFIATVNQFMEQAMALSK